MVRFLNLPYKEFNSAGTASILEFLAFRAFISGAFGGLQGAILNAPQEETLLALQGANRIVRQEEMLLNVDNSVILAFLLASSWGPSPPQVAKNWPFSQPPIQRIYQRRDHLHFGIFSLLGFHFWCFWWPPRSNS